jgi:hypothetical protein
MKRAISLKKSKKFKKNRKMQKITKGDVLEREKKLKKELFRRKRFSPQPRLISKSNTYFLKDRLWLQSVAMWLDQSKI